VEDFKVQALCGSTPIGHAMLRSKDRLIDELVDILWLQHLMCLVVHFQDVGEFLTGHGRYLHQSRTL